MKTVCQLKVARISQESFLSVYSFITFHWNVFLLFRCKSHNHCSKPFLSSDIVFTEFIQPRTEGGGFLIFTDSFSCFPCSSPDLRKCFHKHDSRYKEYVYEYSQNNPQIWQQQKNSTRLVSIILFTDAYQKNGFFIPFVRQPLVGPLQLLLIRNWLHSLMTHIKSDLLWYVLITSQDINSPTTGRQGWRIWVGLVEPLYFLKKYLPIQSDWGKSRNLDICSKILHIPWV